MSAKAATKGLTVKFDLSPASLLAAKQARIMKEKKERASRKSKKKSRRESAGGASASSGGSKMKTEPGPGPGAPADVLVEPAGHSSNVCGDGAGIDTDADGKQSAAGVEGAGGAVVTPTMIELQGEQLPRVERFLLDRPIHLKGVAGLGKKE